MKIIFDKQDNYGRDPLTRDRKLYQGDPALLPTICRPLVWPTQPFGQEFLLKKKGRHGAISFLSPTTAKMAGDLINEQHYIAAM
jgi:hypothetical protein